MLYVLIVGLYVALHLKTLADFCNINSAVMIVYTQRLVATLLNQGLTQN